MSLATIPGSYGYGAYNANDGYSSIDSYSINSSSVPKSSSSASPTTTSTTTEPNLNILPITQVQSTPLPATTPPRKSNTELYVIAALTLVALICLVALIISIVRKKRRTNNIPPTMPPLEIQPTQVSNYIN